MTYFKRAIFSLLAVLFFSNVTFAHAIDFHLCQGEFESLAFFGQKASCSKMMEAEMAAPRSCCDAKIKRTGLVFRQKSCCENVQVLQDNILDKPSLDLEQSNFSSFNLINNFEELSFNFDQNFRILRKVEIPPPPNIYSQHSQEKLQVFII